jgi:endonuclease/exonuclease/phosphatase family metal-dependent hydrolase
MSVQKFSVAFYNVENLFDTEDGKNTLDKDYTPKGKKKWGPYRYQLKLNKIGNALSKIGEECCDLPPLLIGLAEVENSQVLNDLTQSKHLKEMPYAALHYKSSDERGMDTALMYRTDYFQVLESKPLHSVLFDKQGKREYTRDILYVKGLFQGETLHVYVNHWPSKRTGHEETKTKRNAVAQFLRTAIENIPEKNPNILVMGDFNDNPTDESLATHLNHPVLTNPMLPLFQEGQGSSKFYGKWMLFDQILISKNLVKSPKIQFQKAKIFNAPFLTNPLGKFKGEPFRTYTGKYYLGGASDHFPVYLIFETSHLQK